MKKLLVIVAFLLQAMFGAVSPAISTATRIIWNIPDKPEQLPMLMVVGDVKGGYNAIMFDPVKHSEKDIMSTFAGPAGYELSRERDFKNAIGTLEGRREFVEAQIATVRVLEKNGRLASIVFIRKASILK